MDISAISWVFAIVIFLLYIAIQLRKCSQNYSNEDRVAQLERELREQSESRQSIFTVEQARQRQRMYQNTSLQQDCFNDLYDSNRVQVYMPRTSIYCIESEKDKIDLPTYDELMEMETFANKTPQQNGVIITNTAVVDQQQTTDSLACCISSASINRT